MISCTEFIPAYSELFKYMDKKGGRQSVYDYWHACFTPSETSGLYSKLLAADRKVRGCWDYWTHTLNEEAADFTFMVDDEEGYYGLVMHGCPSKGRLLELQKKGLNPFDEYCKHCDGYRQSCEKAGLNYAIDYTGCDEARCAILVTDPKLFKGDAEKLMKEIQEPGWGKDCPNQY